MLLYLYVKRYKRKYINILLCACIFVSLFVYIVIYMIV